jgi:hypothetical protein
LPRGFARRIIDVPPPTETRMKTDEVMVQIRSDVGVERLRAAVARLGVSITASEDLPILARRRCACTSTTVGARLRLSAHWQRCS